jgi:hypothetical protein
MTLGPILRGPRLGRRGRLPRAEQFARVDHAGRTVDHDGEGRRGRGGSAKPRGSAIGSRARRRRRSLNLAVADHPAGTPGDGRWSPFDSHNLYYGTKRARASSRGSNSDPLLYVMTEIASPTPPQRGPLPPLAVRPHRWRSAKKAPVVFREHDSDDENDRENVAALRSSRAIPRESIEASARTSRPSATSAEAGTEQPLTRRGSTIDLAPNSVLRSKRRDFSPV